MPRPGPAAADVVALGGTGAPLDLTKMEDGWMCVDGGEEEEERVSGPLFVKQRGMHLTKHSTSNWLLIVKDTKDI